MARTGTIPLLIAGAFMIAQPAFGQGDGDRYYEPHMWDGGWWLVLGPLGMIVFIAVIVAIIIVLVRWFGGTGHPVAHAQPPSGTAMDILKERFARGEIDEEEFADRRRLLE